MARIARVVAPGYPHHVTQRGCRRQQTFFTRSDYQYYLELLKKAKHEAGVSVWAYCIMPNHVHLVVVPESEQGLAKFLGVAHRQYALALNNRMRWKGHFWQERFHSFVMNESHLYAAVRYVELNPVRARLCTLAREWEWSSARAHMSAKNDGLVEVHPMLERVEDWENYLSCYHSEVSDTAIRQHSRTGRPAGDDKFLEGLEILTNRRLKKRKPGPKPGN
jgi:putative transposase